MKRRPFVSMSVFRRIVRKYHATYGRHDLPWRQTHDTYAILVSEMMLQQTQVHRVIPYFERWIKKYPTPHTLAAAPLSEVLKMWSGLGYNRRAKYVHDASKILSRNSIFSNRSRKNTVTEGELRTLPGVGEYTAKAVRVFVWNQPDVLIETNVRAVFIHHFFPRGRKVSDARLLPLIEESLKGQDPRTWYAALMDYGSHLKTTSPNPSRKSKHHAKQPRFENSLRQVRGAILRAYTRKESLRQVERLFPEKFATALVSLQKDGLI